MNTRVAKIAYAKVKTGPRRRPAVRRGSGSAKRSRFVDRFDAFRDELDSFLDGLPDECDDQAAAVQSAVDEMADDLSHRPQTIPA
jgi:hypothetical protein